MPLKQTTKARILEKASQIFYKHGYRATGVEFVAEAVGVTKATLYHHFESKDELIEETLKYLSEYHRGNYVKAWSKKDLSQKQRLTALFDAMDAAFKEPNFYGCPFTNAAAEYTDRKSAVRTICKNHYAFLIDHLEQFARDANLTKPRIVAEQIAGCIMGSYSACFAGGLKNAAEQGKKTAELIIAHHTRAT